MVVVGWAACCVIVGQSAVCRVFDCPVVSQVVVGLVVVGPVVVG